MSSTRDPRSDGAGPASSQLGLPGGRHLGRVGGRRGLGERWWHEERGAHGQGPRLVAVRVVDPHGKREGRRAAPGRAGGQSQGGPWRGKWRRGVGAASRPGEQVCYERATESRISRGRCLLLLAGAAVPLLSSRPLPRPRWAAAGTRSAGPREAHYPSRPRRPASRPTSPVGTAPDQATTAGKSSDPSEPRRAGPGPAAWIWPRARSAAPTQLRAMRGHIPPMWPAAAALLRCPPEAEMD